MMLLLLGPRLLDDDYDCCEIYDDYDGFELYDEYDCGSLKLLQRQEKLEPEKKCSRKSLQQIEKTHTTQHTKQRCPTFK